MTRLPYGHSMRQTRRSHKVDDLLSMDSWDELLSRPVFQIRLPRLLEYALSVPGNFFGLPAFVVAGPLLLATVCHAGPADPTQTIALSGILLAISIGWCGFCRGNEKIMTKGLFSPALFAVGPPLGVALVHVLVPDAFALAVGTRHALLYSSSIIVVMRLKHGTRRRRPCASAAVDKVAAPRHLQVVFIAPSISGL
jgi:hypothetical protein